MGSNLTKIVALLLLATPFILYQMIKKSGAFCTLLSLPSRIEFQRLTLDISNHQEFLKLKTFYHHTHHIYDHVVRVAYLSYSFSKLFGLDYISSARGGLLHDFFLYDWREKKANDSKRSLHGEQHPFIALANAKLYFTVNKKEEDIIVKHMFPKTKLAPIYAESFVVSMMDKVSTIWEYLLHFGRKTRNIIFNH